MKIEKKQEYTKKNRGFEGDRSIQVVSVGWQESIERMPSATSGFRRHTLSTKEVMDEESLNWEKYLATLWSTQSNPEQWDDSPAGVDRSIVVVQSLVLTGFTLEDTTSLCWVMGGKAWIASIDKGSIKDESDDEEERDEVDVEELEEDMANLSEWMENTSPGCRVRKSEQSK